MVFKFSIRVAPSRTEPTSDGLGTRTVYGKEQLVAVEVDVDAERIAREYGPRAVISKRGRSQQLHGCIVIRRVGKPVTM